MSTQTADQMDTFDNGQVAELPKHDTADSVDLNSQVQNAGIDTFDNEEVIHLHQVIDWYFSAGVEIVGDIQAHSPRNIRRK